MPALAELYAEADRDTQSLKGVAQQLPAMTEDDLAAVLAIQAFKAEALQAWSPGQTWFAWCSTTNTTVTMGDQAWASWNASVSTTTGSLALNYPTGSTYVSTGTQWVSWNVTYTEEAQAAMAEAARVQAEQIAAREAEWAAAQAVRQEAQERAQGLLLSLLSDEQAATYREHGWFEVRGSSGRRWRIRNRGQSGNVDLMPEIGEERDATYCAHPPGHLPDADAHVAQMLALVTDDEAFERTANVHWRNPARQPPFMRAVA